MVYETSYRLVLCCNVFDFRLSKSHSHFPFGELLTTEKQKCGFSEFLLLSFVNYHCSV